MIDTALAQDRARPADDGNPGVHLLQHSDTMAHIVMTAAGRTGPDGTPDAYVVSAAVGGVHDAAGPDLRAATLALRETVQRLRDRHRSEGWLTHDQWHLMRATPAQKRANWSWHTGDVDEVLWRESVAGVPTEYDVVQLHNGWGEVALRAPSLHHVGAWRSAAGFVTSPGVGAMAAADALVDWLVEAVAAPGVSTGYVHADSLADPYGQLVVMQSRLRSAEMAGRVDGYYWTVALGHEHLRPVGGPDVLRRDGLCEVVTEIDVGGAPGLLCQLTRDPRRLTEDRVRAWRDVLAPVLRPGFPGRFDMLWSRLAGLSRPVWLFEGMPTPAATTGILCYDEVVEPPDILLDWQAGEGSAELDLGLALDAEVTPTFIDCMTAVVRA